MTIHIQGERIRALEVRVANLEDKVDELKSDIQTIDSKLDSLLELKNKGAGAFLLVSAIFGTGIVSAVLGLFHYVTGR